jgi:hypothetical protein
MEEKVCSKCGEKLPIICFSFRKDTNKYRGQCNKCYKGYGSSGNLKSLKIKQLKELGLVTCSYCKETKPFTEFGIDVNTAHGYTSRCKKCLKSIRTKNVVHINKLTKIKRYNLKPEDWVLYENSTRCKICGVEFNKNDRKTEKHIDHNHNTKLFRGVLCQSCNFGLGLFNDDLSKLKAAIKYLTVDFEQDLVLKYDTVPFIETLK